MARDGSGTYTLPAGNPVVSGTPITASWGNTTLADIASALTNSIDKGGVTVWTANLPAGNNKITGLAAGSAAGESVRMEQVNSLVAYPSVALAASSTDLGSNLAEVILLTGSSVTVTAFAASTIGIVRKTIFAGVNTLTHSSGFDLIGSANITTAAGDVATWMYQSSGWVMIAYDRKAGSALYTLFSDGTVSAPSFSFVSDTNTGIYRIGADSMGLAAGGLLVGTFSTAGITIEGTTGQTVRLKGKGAGAPGVALETENAATAGSISIAAGDSSVGVGPVVNISAGDGSSTEDGGAINITAGSTTSSTDRGGSVAVSSGAAGDIDSHGDLSLQIAAGGYTRLKIEGTTGHLVIPKGSSSSDHKPTLDSGGGTGATITGSDTLFQIVCGTGAGTTINVDFARSFGTGTNCLAFVNVRETGITAYVEAVGTDGSSINIQLSGAPSNGTKIDVLCISTP